MNITRSLLILFFIAGGVAISGAQIMAEPNRSIEKQEIVQKSQFWYGEELANAGIIKGDAFLAATRIDTSGGIAGDLIAGASDISQSGKVDGDVLCVGETIDLAGLVNGNVRSAGASLTLSGRVGRNALLAGQSIKLKPAASISRNLLAYGEYIRIDGTVKGDTRLGGNRIVLGGRFEGDVDVNVESWWDLESEPVGSITILPGTVINGKLTYRADKQIQIPAGARIAGQSWIQRKPDRVCQTLSPQVVLLDFAKMIVVTVVYFLLAMLLYRLFPVLFREQDEPLQTQPLKTAGVGLLGVLALLAVCLGLILILIFAVTCHAPGLAFFSLFTALGVYSALFYLAGIPVSLWLGNKLLRPGAALPVRFGAGLGIIAVLRFSFQALAQIPNLANVFGFFDAVLCSAVILLGLGALVAVMKRVFDTLKQVDSAR